MIISMLTTDIECLTKQGLEELKHGSLDHAQKTFHFAFEKAQQLGDHFITRACAFNLGAVYVALRSPQPGLEMLYKAIPPMNTNEGHINGDLYFNIGVAYELLCRHKDAIKYFELALEEYQSSQQENWEMEAELGCKLGAEYMQLDNPLQAARGYGIAATAYANGLSSQYQVSTLCKQAAALLQAQRQEDALRAADDSIILCQRVNQSGALGKLYGELGLVYAQCHEFSRAAACFELALPLTRGPKTDKKGQAVVLQNLGAVYNSLGDYQRSLKFHEAAASLYAELGSRSSQGQCFANLAFAYSQLGDMERAGEFYLHGLQAARDAGDLRSQWQALEGLGAVAFNQGKVNYAVRHFKEALAIVAASRENNTVGQERIMGKLTSAFEYQLGKGTASANTRLPSIQKRLSQMERVNILVNDQPRPPTAQEKLHMQQLRAKRLSHLKEYDTGRVPSDFEKVALGVGEYDSDSDLSVGRPGRKIKRSQSQVSRDTVDQCRDRPRHRGRGSKVRAASEGQVLSPSKYPYKRRASRRLNAFPAAGLSGSDVDSEEVSLRRQNRPLLRTETYDSEGEWRRHMGEVSSVSSDEYAERLFPPSTDEEATTDEELTRGWRPVTSLQRKVLHTMQHFSKSTESEDSSLPPALYGKDGSSKKLTPRSNSAPHRKETAPAVETQKKTDADADVETNNVAKLYEDRLQQMEEDEGTTGTGSETDSASASEESDTADEETGSETVKRTVAAEVHSDRKVPPPLPEQGPPTTLLNTYEDPVTSPVQGAGAKASGSHQGLADPPSVNYYRDRSDGHKEQLSAGNTLKVRAPDENDPTYMTIRTFKIPSEGEPVPGPSNSQTLPPPPPPPRPPSKHDAEGQFEQLSRAEQEKLLYEYQKMRDENMRERDKQQQMEGSVASHVLSKKTKDRKKSLVCVVM